jgi:hypothetical protein
VNQRCVQRPFLYFQHMAMDMTVLKPTLVVATVKECILVEVVVVHSDRCPSMPYMTSDSETARDESLLELLTQATSRRFVQE